MKKLLKGIFVIAALAVSPSTMAVVLDIDFNGTQLLLGTFDSAETGASFYRYGSSSASSANPVYPGTSTLIPLQADAMQVFSHLNTSTNQLSFGIILEKPNGSGGGSFSATADWSDPAVLALVDDPGETGVLGSGGPQSLFLNWINCCTDGFVISGFDPTDLFINLTNMTGSDLTQVIFLSPDGPNANTVFEFPSQAFSISIRPSVGVVPIPAALPLFLSGLAGLGVAARRRKQSAA